MFLSLWRTWSLVALTLSLVATANLVLPPAWVAARLWWWWNEPYSITESVQEDFESSDPDELTDYHLANLGSKDYEREISAALDSGDDELAQSIGDLSSQRNVQISDQIKSRVASTLDGWWITPWVDQITELGIELSPLGDVRDLRDAYDAYPNQDNLTAGLALTGVVTLAATVLSVGAATPATVPGKIGAAALKGARKLGKLNPELLSDLRRVVDGAINPKALRDVAENAKNLDWKAVVSAGARVMPAENLSVIKKSAFDVGILAKTRGVKATQDTLALATSTAKLSTLAILAERSGTAFRGVLKMSKGKILGAVKKTRKVTKLVTRGAMTFDVLAKLVSLMAAALGWLLTFFWVAAKIVWRVAHVLRRRVDRQPAIPL